MTKVAPQALTKESGRKVIQKSERHSSMGTRRNDSPPPKPRVTSEPAIERPAPEKKKVEPKRFDANEFRIKRQQTGTKGTAGQTQDSGHYEVHYRASVFKPPNFAWYRKDKAQSDFKGLCIQLQNNNEVCIVGTRVTKDEEGETTETKKQHHILIKLT